ncbi:MAG: polymerase sigma-70 factor, subfamily [Ilumatobacteraceae bacterium]|nr:polymerase sigma-70 factor, subfamily [Ilumatobacteraceae bacterium]
MTMTIVRPVKAVSSTGPTDVSLVARIAVGDDRALHLIYERYSPLVYGLARRVTASTAHAEEITQEVFVYFWQNPDRFDPERGTLRAFLGALTHRRAVDEVRRNTRRTAREDRVGSDATNFFLPEIGDDLDRSQTAERVRAAVSSLPEQQRQAVLLAYFGGCTFRQVAEQLGIPEGTAKSRLRLGLAKLAGLLEGLT